MKKLIALVLVIILLASIIGTALAACNHRWDLINSYTTISKTTIAKPNGCVKLSVPHTHIRYDYYTVRTFVCISCGQTKKTKTLNTRIERCPKG